MKDNRLREIFLSDPYCKAYTKRKGKIYTYSSEQLATGSWSNECMHCGYLYYSRKKICVAIVL